jgi:hypothetical protein
MNERRKAAAIASRVRYIELASISECNQKFAAASAMKQV